MRAGEDSFGLCHRAQFAECDMAGQVIGINTAIITGGRGYEGVGFALPSAISAAQLARVKGNALSQPVAGDDA